MANNIANPIADCRILKMFGIIGCNDEAGWTGVLKRVWLGIQGVARRRESTFAWPGSIFCPKYLATALARECTFNFR